MKIIKITEFKTVEQFLTNNFSAPTHWPDWNIVVCKHYNTNFYYFAAYENNQLIGICPVHEIKKGLLKNIHSGQINYIPNGGWIFSLDTDFDLSSIKLQTTKSLSISSLPLLKEFKVNYIPKGIYHLETLIIDLDQSTEEIWLNNVNSKRRNMIRKAEKSGVIIKKQNTSEINIFYKYYHAANTNYKIGTHSIDFFKDLLKTAQNISFNIWFAYQNNEIIGSIVTVNDKNYASYWLGISVEGAVNLGQGELLQWEAIIQMKAKGCKYYDLCYIEKEKLPRIYRFKSGFSKTVVPVFGHRKKSMLFSILNKIQKKNQ